MPRSLMGKAVIFLGEHICFGAMAYFLIPPQRNVSGEVHNYTPYAVGIGLSLLISRTFAQHRHENWFGAITKTAILLVAGAVIYARI